MDPFDEKHPKSLRLKSFPLRQSAYISDDFNVTVDAAVDTLNALRDYGVFTTCEIPPVLLQAFHVDYYLTQVTNGGHAQFLLNSLDVKGLTQDILGGLENMAALNFRSLFQEIVDRRNLFGFSNTDTSFIDSAGNLSDQDGEWLSLKDDVFYELNRTSPLRRSICDWVRIHASPVPDLQWKFEIQKLIASNTLRSERLAALNRNDKDFVADLITNAPLKKPFIEYAKELCSKYGIELPDWPIEQGTEIHEGDKIWWNTFRTPQGIVMVAFRNRSEVYLFETKQTDDGKHYPIAPPKAKLSMEQIEV